MKKRICASLGALMMAFVGITGCSEPEPKEQVNITVWHYYNGDIKNQFDDMVKLFNSTVGYEKGIVVDAYTQGGVDELADTVFAAANKEVDSDELPEVFAAYPDSAYDMDKLGVVASLDEYFTNKELKEYRTEFLDSGRLGTDKNLKIFPVAKSTELLFINDTVFKEFSKDTGVDASQLQTWDGLVNVSKEYYEWSEGKAFFGIDSMSNFMIEGIKQQGEDIFVVEDGKATFNFKKEYAKRLWDTYYVPYIKGYFTAEGRFRSDDLKNGTIACFVGSTSSASYFPTEIETGKDISHSISSLVMKYPYFDEKFAIEQGAGMVVVKNEKIVEEACVEFLKWFTAEEQNMKFAIETSYLPVKNNTLSNEKVEEALGGDVGSTNYQASKVAIEMIDEYKLYSTYPFDNGGVARKLLNSSLSDFANKDRKELQETIGLNKIKGVSVEKYVSEENFDRWYNSLVSEMGNLIN